MAQDVRTLLFNLVLGAVLALPIASLGIAQESTATAQFVSHNLPARLDIGQTFRVELAVRNVGTAPWTRDNLTVTVKPASAEQGWGVTKIELAPTDTIEPGQTKTFVFDVTAPAVPGTYSFAWELLYQGAAAGAPAAPADIVVEDPHLRGVFVSQLLPNQIAAGEKFKAFIQYRNTGKSSWSRRQGHRLAAVAPDSLKHWGIDKVELDVQEHILPGQTATFTFIAEAPARAGHYPFQWQLYQDDRRFFGDRTPATSIFVGTIQDTDSEKLDAEFVSASIPDALRTNTTYTVTLLFKNTGQTPWRSGQVVLRPHESSGNLTWFTDRVDLDPGEIVEPGDIKSFEFNIHTPPDAGRYGFQWNLADPHGQSFGDASELRELAVEK